MIPGAIPGTCLKMEEIFQKIWESAKPYYQKGRPMDIDHIQWMMLEAEKVVTKENIDESLFFPLVILHDVGYAISGPAYFQVNMKKEHMIAGEKIARKILSDLDYPSEKVGKIAYYISVHDNWIFGLNDLYKQDNVLGTFNDLDFIWMTNIKGFEAVREVLKKSPHEMIEYLENNEKLVSRPFCTESTRQLFIKNIRKLKQENINF
jgi:hypothetical protein